jgi:hypothetical protein
MQHSILQQQMCVLEAYSLRFQKLFRALFHVDVHCREPLITRAYLNEQCVCMCVSCVASSICPHSCTPCALRMKQLPYVLLVKISTAACMLYMCSYYYRTAAAAAATAIMQTHKQPLTLPLALSSQTSHSQSLLLF